MEVIKEKDGFVIHGGKKRLLSLCRCVCGTEVHIRKDLVFKTKSCGCSSITGSPATDLTGKTFNFLTVLARATNKGQNIMWNCLCICGQETIIQGKALVSGHSKSCGCRGRERAFGFVSQMFANYRAAAKRRNLDFHLSHAEFSNLIKQNCHYCASSPVSKEDRADVKRGVFKEVIPINGVDRKDNSIGYVLTNCLPCCSICNRAKSTMLYVDFVRWIDSIKKHSVAGSCNEV